LRERLSVCYMLSWGDGYNPKVAAAPGSAFFEHPEMAATLDPPW